MQQRQRGGVWPQHDNWIVRSLVFMIVLTLALLAVALQALPTTASRAGHLDLAAPLQVLAWGKASPIWCPVYTIYKRQALPGLSLTSGLLTANRGARPAPFVPNQRRSRSPIYRGTVAPW
jgi:hypothetical protein